MHLDVLPNIWCIVGYNEGISKVSAFNLHEAVSCVTNTTWQQLALQHCIHDGTLTIWRPDITQQTMITSNTTTINSDVKLLSILLPLLRTLILTLLSRAGQFRWKQIRFDSAEFLYDSIHYFCVTWGRGHLWTVVCTVKCTRKIINSYFFGISGKCTVT